MCLSSSIQWRYWYVAIRDCSKHTDKFSKLIYSNDIQGQWKSNEEKAARTCLTVRILVRNDTRGKILTDHNWREKYLIIPIPRRGWRLADRWPILQQGQKKYCDCWLKAQWWERERDSLLNHVFYGDILPLGFKSTLTFLSTVQHQVVSC